MSVYLKLSAASNCGWLGLVNLFPITPICRLHSQPCGAIVSLPPKVWRSYPVLSSPNGIGLWIRCSDTGINHPAVKGRATLPAYTCTICTSTYISSTPVGVRNLKSFFHASQFRFSFFVKIVKSYCTRSFSSFCLCGWSSPGSAAWILPHLFSAASTIPQTSWVCAIESWSSQSLHEFLSFSLDYCNIMSFCLQIEQFAFPCWIPFFSLSQLPQTFFKTL